MNEHTPQYIELEEKPDKNTFPIYAQLGILAFVMMLIFGSFLLQPHKEKPAITQNQPTLSANVRAAVPPAISDIQLQAKAAYVWDVQSQSSLFAKNADDILPLASITKLMTALLAYELIDQDKKANISLSAIQQEGSSGLAAGEQIVTKELSELALVSSSNDAAYALAANVGQALGENDPALQFVHGMNIRAKELNLETLEFKNMTGLDISTTEAGATGSAADVSRLMEFMVTQYPEILEPTKQSATRVYNTAGAYHDIENTNAIAREIPNMLGSKTGFTDLAGGNLTIAFDAGLNRPVIITVLGSTRDERFTDVLKLVAAVQESLGTE